MPLVTCALKDGWLGVAGIGPLEQIEQMINSLREGARKAGRDPSSVKVYILIYPNVLDSSSPSSQTRTPMAGTIDQIGSDIEQIKRMHVEHIMFGYIFSAIGRDTRKMIEVTKQLAQFAK